MTSEQPAAAFSERFRVAYRLAGDESWARATAEDICLEQTVEFPAALVPSGDLHDHVVGRIESFAVIDDTHYEAIISYAAETAGCELTQLLNVVFGNYSLKPGVRVARLDLPDGLLAAFKGPRFGRAGLRSYLHVAQRPLLCTALKPMGLGAPELADLAYKLALGGIDIIKDDHGLADQPFAPFEERVQRCAEAVARANRETGRSCIYVPNVTASADVAMRRAVFAKGAGAGGLLISPGLAGFGVLTSLVADDRIALPVLSHPALQGSFVTTPDSGISHFALFGQIARLAGADATIYPNYGGRFAFNRDDCRSIADGAATPMGSIKPIFPAPGGGLSLSRVPELLEVYGHEVIFLIGGGLHQHGPDLIENCRFFLRLVEAGPSGES